MIGLRVAVHHGPARSGELEANLAAADVAAARAAAAGAHILVLPQRFLTGRREGRDAARRAAQLSDGAAPRRLAGIARQHGLAILCGYLEACTGRYHDSALLVDGRGCALANYRRTHPDAGGDTDEGDEPVSHGHWLTVAAFAGRKFGILIGADVEAPEPARALALAGATVLLVPARHGAGAAIVGDALLPARAFENGCAVAYANGDDAPGAPRSRIVGPDGAVLAEAEDGLAVAEVPAEAPPQAARRLAGRRPRLYQKLAAAAAGEEGPRL